MVFPFFGIPAAGDTFVGMSTNTNVLTFCAPLHQGVHYLLLRVKKAYNSDVTLPLIKQKIYFYLG